MPDERGDPPGPTVVEELRRLARDYASGVDRRDRDLLLSVFHPDGTLIVQRPNDPAAKSAGPMHGHDEIGRITNRIAVYAQTFHFLGQSSYWITGPGAAAGEVSCIAHHRWRDEVDLDHVMYIRYADEYRTGADGRWRIATRSVVVDWTETQVINLPGRTVR
jgi:hypothetical protein